MVQAIGSGSGYPGPSTGSSAGVLEAQLNRYQIQLADWCSCPSGKTPEGMATIQRLQNQVDAVKTQLARMDAAKKHQVAPESLAGSNANMGLATTRAPDAVTATGLSSIGSLLDTFA